MHTPTGSMAPFQSPPPFAQLQLGFDLGTLLLFLVLGCAAILPDWLDSGRRLFVDLNVSTLVSLAEKDDLDGEIVPVSNDIG